MLEWPHGDASGLGPEERPVMVDGLEPLHRRPNGQAGSTRASSRLEILRRNGANHVA